MSTMMKIYIVLVWPISSPLEHVEKIVRCLSAYFEMADSTQWQIVFTNSAGRDTFEEDGGWSKDNVFDALDRGGQTIKPESSIYLKLTSENGETLSFNYYMDGGVDDHARMTVRLNVSPSRFVEGKIGAFVEELIFASGDLDYAQMSLLKQGVPKEEILITTGIPYTLKSVSCTDYLNVFSSRFLNNHMAGRLYLQNVSAWKIESISTPSGEGMAFWSYDPTEFLSREVFQETPGEAYQRKLMNSEIVFGQLQRPSDRKTWSPCRLWKPRSGIYEAESKTLWVTRNVLADEDQELVAAEWNDYGVIIKCGFLPGDDEQKPIEQVAVVFSRREAAEANLLELSKRGVQTWYIDPEEGRSQLPIPEGIVGWKDGQVITEMAR